MEVLEKAINILTKPDEFFKKAKKDDLGTALKYYALIALVPAVIVAIMMIVLGSAFSMASLFMPWENSEQAALAPALGAFIPALGVGIAIAMYVMIIVGSFINAAFMHIFVYIVGGRKGYTSTFNAMAYASTPSLLLGWIPVVNIITGIWALVLEVKGIRTLHEITTGKAILAILLPVIILLGIIGASVGLLFGFMSAAGS